MEQTNQGNWDFKTDKPTQPKIPGIGWMINHTQCLSDNLDNIYTQKSMSISRYLQSAILTTRKCIVNDMVQDSCTTTNKWHQLAALVWYDCPICAKMMVLTTLLSYNIHHDDDHQCKKNMNAQSRLWWWHHMSYKNRSRSMKKAREHIAIQNNWIHSC